MSTCFPPTRPDMDTPSRDYTEGWIDGCAYLLEYTGYPPLIAKALRDWVAEQPPWDVWQLCGAVRQALAYSINDSQSEWEAYDTLLDHWAFRERPESENPEWVRDEIEVLEAEIDRLRTHLGVCDCPDGEREDCDVCGQFPGRISRYEGQLQKVKQIQAALPDLPEVTKRARAHSAREALVRRQYVALLAHIQEHGYDLRGFQKDTSGQKDNRPDAT